MFIGLAVLLVLCVQFAHAEWEQCETAEAAWVTHDKGQGQSMGYGMDSSSSHIWVAGTFRNSLNIQGPSVSITEESASTHNDVSSDDVYIAKLDFDGNPQLIADFEGEGREIIIDLAVSGNMLAITGYHLGNLTFGNDKVENTKSVDSFYYDGFTAFFDISSGSPVYQWSTTVENTRATKTTGVAIDANGNVGVTGYSCEEDIAGGINSDTGMYNDLCKGFTKLYANANGAIVWEHEYAEYFPSGINTSPTAILVIGSLESTSTFGPHSYTLIGSQDAVIVKMDPSDGSYDWVAGVGAASTSVSGWDLTVADGFVYAVGGGYIGSQSGYLVKLDASTGTKAFTKSLPSSRGVVVSNDGQFVYMMNYQYAPLVLGPVTLDLVGSTDMILFKVNATNGDGIWIKNMGGNGLEYPWSMAKDVNGDIYVSGLTGSESFSFDGEDFVDHSIGFNNVFITKWNTAIEPLPSCMVGSCGNIAAGHCFIGNKCFATGASSPFSGKSCFSCDSSSSTVDWTGPASSSCYISGQCYNNNELKSNSKCQVCDIATSTSAWSLKPGFNLAQDGETCGTDRTVTGEAPGCPGSLVYNENFCGSVEPCYDSTTDSCSAAVSVCGTGAIYTDQCPDFPLQPCYDIASHDCVDAIVSLAGQGVNCGNTGQFIFTSACPAEFPCYDHINRFCVEAEDDNNNGSARRSLSVLLLLMLFSFF